jgi:hypothetical protein
MPSAILGALMEPGPVNAPLPGSAVPSGSNTPAAPAVFVSLINLLLGPAVPDSNSDPTINSALNSNAPDEPSEALTRRSPQSIADALIRSMLGGSMLGGSMLSGSMLSRSIASSSAVLPTAVEGVVRGVLAVKPKAQAGTTGRKESSAAPVAAPLSEASAGTKPVLIMHVPAVPAMPVVTLPLETIPVAPPLVATITETAPALSPTLPASRSAQMPGATPPHIGPPQNIPQPVPEGTVPDGTALNWTKTLATPQKTSSMPELAFGLRLTPAQALKTDVSTTQEEPVMTAPNVAPPSHGDPSPSGASEAPAESADTAGISATHDLTNHDLTNNDLTNKVTNEIATDAVSALATVATPELALKPTSGLKEPAPKLPTTPPAAPAGAKLNFAPEPAQTSVPVVMAVAATPGVGDPPSSFSPSTTAEPIERAPQTAAEVLRASEPAAPPESAPPPASAQGIAVRIAMPDTPSVDVHVMERAGQVQVSVRTPDTGLQSSLRQDLGTLVNALERSGFHTETFTPHDGVAPASSPMNLQNNSRQQDPGGSSGSGSHDGRPGSQQQHGQQRRHGEESETWIETMENAA